MQREDFTFDYPLHDAEKNPAKIIDLTSRCIMQQRGSTRSGKIGLPAASCSGESNFNSNNSTNLKPNVK
jgi:hypothetical protein